MLEYQDQWIKLVVPAKGARPEVAYLVLYPVYMMLAMAIDDEAVLDDYVAGGLQHTWGRHVLCRSLKRAAQDVKAGLLADPERCTDDGLAYEEPGKQTRDYLLVLCDQVESQNAGDDEAVAWVFDEALPCGCEYCQGASAAKPPTDIQADFLKSWRGAHE